MVYLLKNKDILADALGQEKVFLYKNVYSIFKKTIVLVLDLAA